MKENALPESLRSQSVPEVSSSECIKYKHISCTSSVTYICNPCAMFLTRLNGNVPKVTQFSVHQYRFSLIYRKLTATMNNHTKLSCLLDYKKWIK